MFVENQLFSKTLNWMHVLVSISSFNPPWMLDFDLLLLVLEGVQRLPLGRPDWVHEGVAVVETRPGSGPTAAVVTCQHISGPLEIIGVHPLVVVPAAAAGAGDAAPTAAPSPQQRPVCGGPSERLVLPPVQPVQGLASAVVFPQKGVHQRHGG